MVSFVSLFSGVGLNTSLEKLPIFSFTFTSLKKVHVIQRRTQTSLFFFETKTVSPWSTFFGWFCFVTCQSLAKLLVLVCCSLCFQKKVCLLHDSLLLFCLLQKTLFLWLAQQLVFVYCTTSYFCWLHNFSYLFIAQKVISFCCTTCWFFHCMII